MLSLHPAAAIACLLWYPGRLGMMQSGMRQGMQQQGQRMQPGMRQGVLQPGQGVQRLGVQLQCQGMLLLCATAGLLLLLAVPAGCAHRPSQYAVDCPESCHGEECTSTTRCKRTVMDDCGCCRVCAAALGETCYRTVSGMDGAKCGPGLRCSFHSQEDDFGDEFGVCRECPYGTYGMECRETCRCQSGICDRVTGKCLTFPFFQHTSTKPVTKRKATPATEHAAASGDGNDIKVEPSKDRTTRISGIKWLNPR